MNWLKRQTQIQQVFEAFALFRKSAMYLHFQKCFVKKKFDCFFYEGRSAIKYRALELIVDLSYYTILFPILEYCFV